MTNSRHDKDSPFQLVIMFDAHALPRKAISFGDTLPGYWWKLVSKNTPKQQPIVIEPMGHADQP